MPSFGHRPVRLPCASCEFSYSIRVDTTGLKSAAQGTVCAFTQRYAHPVTRPGRTRFGTRCRRRTKS